MELTQANLDRLVTAHWDTVKLVDQARANLSDFLERVDYEEIEELTDEPSTAWAANIVYDAINSIAMDLVDSDEWEPYSAYDAQGAQDAFAFLKNLEEIEEVFAKTLDQPPHGVVEERRD